MSQLFPVSPALNNFCQSPHFSHPSGHRSLEKVRRGVGDFNLVSTSSNLKGRAGGVREGDITGRGRSRGKYHQSWRILSTMTRREGDRERRREGGKQTGKREIMCRLIGPGAREPGESRDPGRGRRLFIGHSCESRHGGWDWPARVPGPKKIGNKVRSRGKLQSLSGQKVPYMIKLNWRTSLGSGLIWLNLALLRTHKYSWCLILLFTEANEVGLTFN